MRVITKSSTRRTAMSLAAAATVVALVAGCSSSKKPAASAPLVRTAATGTQATPATTAKPAATDTGLSGSWTGQYGGSFNGTFNLNWQQSGSNLTGTIQLSTPPMTLSINGALNGSTIRFGTVGGIGITYTGAVSGSSMSGSYAVNAGKVAAGGPWSAKKSS
jgi:hypothetical protein